MKEPELDGAAHYGDNCAEFYDEIYSTVDPRIIKALTALGNNGRVLELGVGTGCGVASNRRGCRCQRHRGFRRYAQPPARKSRGR